MFVFMGRTFRNDVDHAKKTVTQFFNSHSVFWGIHTSEKLQHFRNRDAGRYQSEKRVGRSSPMLGGLDILEPRLGTFWKYHWKYVTAYFPWIEFEDIVCSTSPRVRNDGSVHENGSRLELESENAVHEWIVKQKESAIAGFAGNVMNENCCLTPHLKMMAIMSFFIGHIDSLADGKLVSRCLQHLVFVKT